MNVLRPAGGWFEAGPVEITSVTKYYSSVDWVKLRETQHFLGEV